MVCIYVYIRRGDRELPGDIQVAVVVSFSRRQYMYMSSILHLDSLTCSRLKLFIEMYAIDRMALLCCGIRFSSTPYCVSIHSALAQRESQGPFSGHRLRDRAPIRKLNPLSSLPWFSLPRLNFHALPWKHTRVGSSKSAMAGDDVSHTSTSSMASEVHPLAASGFNADQSIYELARPSYPPAVVELVKQEIVPSLGNPASASTLSVLDLAAGTGKWTRLILPFGIGQLVAVEPSPGMRAEFQQLYPDVVILDGSGTAIPLPDASVDVIFIAQAFHWFANVAALTEMHRVLKKEGTVIMIWNMEDRKISWVARLREAYEKHEAGSPQYRLGLWRRPFEEPDMVKEVSKLFRLPIQERQVSHSVSNTKTGVWQRVLSKSYIAVLGVEEKEELKKEVDQILAGQDIHWDIQGDDKVLQMLGICPTCEAHVQYRASKTLWTSFCYECTVTLSMTVRAQSPPLFEERKRAVSFAYVWPVQHRPTIEHDDFTDLEIPTVDLSSLNSEGEDARKQVVADVRAACLNWGFFHAINHGIQLELLDRVQKQAQKFFNLAKEEKLKVSKAPGSVSGYGHAAVKPTDSQPWSEGLYLANDGSMKSFEQTLWPKGNNNEFVDSYKEYNEKVENLAKQLMNVIIEGLEVNAAHFQRYIEKAFGLLRWNHYPLCPQPHKALGMSAHTDFNLLTVLHQGDIGGLQVQKPDHCRS